MSADLPTPGPLTASLAGRVRVAEPPAALLRSLADRFDSWAADRRPRSLPQRLAAALTSTGPAGVVVAGLRGAATDRARQLLFTTDVAEIALHVADGGPVAVIDGQVLPLDESLGDDVVVELWRDEVLCASVDADEAGSFVLDRVPAGRYRLVVAWADLEIAVEPVEVDPAG